MTTFCPLHVHVDQEPTVSDDRATESDLLPFRADHSPWCFVSNHLEDEMLPLVVHLHIAQGMYRTSLLHGVLLAHEYIALCKNKRVLVIHLGLLSHSIYDFTTAMECVNLE